MYWHSRALAALGQTAAAQTGYQSVRPLRLLWSVSTWTLGQKLRGPNKQRLSPPLSLHKLNVIADYKMLSPYLGLVLVATR